MTTLAEALSTTPSKVQIRSVGIEKITEVVDLVREVFPNEIIEFKRNGVIRVYDTAFDAFDHHFSRLTPKYLELDIFSRFSFVALEYNRELYHIRTSKDKVTNYTLLKLFLESIRKTFWGNDTIYEDYIEFYSFAFDTIRKYRYYNLNISDGILNISHNRQEISAKFDRDKFDNKMTIARIMEIMVSSRGPITKAKISKHKSATARVMKNSQFALLHEMFGVGDVTKLVRGNGDKLKIKFKSATGLSVMIHLIYTRKGKKLERSISILKGTDISQDLIKRIGHTIANFANDELSFEKIIADFLISNNNIKSLEESEGKYILETPEGVTVKSEDLFSLVRPFID